MNDGSGGGAWGTLSFVIYGLILLASLSGVALGVVPLAPGVAVAAAGGLLLLWRGVAAARAVGGARGQAESVSRVFSASEAVLSSLDVNHVLQAAAEVGGRLSRHASAAVLFLTDEARRPVSRASWGIDPPPPPDARFPMLDAHLNEVLKGRKPSLAPVSSADRHAALHGLGAYHSFCLLPLQSKGGMVGVLVLLSHKGVAAFRQEQTVLEYFASQAAMAIDNARLYQQVQDLFLSSIKSLAAAVDAKDAYTHGHSEDIAELVSMIARELRLPPREEEKVRLAGLLHDVGKIGIPDAILRKPGKLDADERAIMMTHVTLGAAIIDRPGPLRDLVAIVRHHHERYDGRGYPDGLRGTEIPIGAAILSVADAFHAMTSHRAYHVAKDVDAALEELNQHAGTQFHPQVVEALVRIVNREQSAGTAWYQQLEHRVRDTSTGQQSIVHTQAQIADEIDLAWRLSQEVRHVEDLQVVLDRITRSTLDALCGVQCAILLIDGKEQALTVAAAAGDGTEKGAAVPRGRSLVWQAIEQRAAQRQDDGSMICAPLFSAGRPVGVIQATGTGFGEPAMRLLSRLADTMAPIIHAALLRAKTEQSGAADEVTGLLNRRALVARLQDECRRHQRYGTRSALALADIQGLAEFNALYGYDAGDELLQRIAEIMSPGMRQTDFAARLDGGTFAILMPELDGDEADRAARRVQEMLAERQVIIRGQFLPIPPLTWAVAACPHDGTSADTLLAQAEKRLASQRQHMSH